MFIPGDWTYQNIADMRAQLKPMGLSIDWSREFATCDPEYYGQQQSMFIDMMSKGVGLSQKCRRQLGSSGYDSSWQMSRLKMVKVGGRVL